MNDALAESDFPYGDETYALTRAVILTHVPAQGVPPVLRTVIAAMRAAYEMGRGEERRQQLGGTVELATLQELPPEPCCCTRAEGRHCPSCHGQGHATAIDTLPHPALGDTMLIPVVLPT